MPKVSFVRRPLCCVCAGAVNNLRKLVCWCRSNFDTTIQLGLLPSIIGIAALNHDQPSDAIGLPPCVFTLLFRKPCFGCGTGRALCALLNGNFEASWTMNRLAIPVLMTVVVIWCNALVALCGVKKNGC